MSPLHHFTYVDTPEHIVACLKDFDPDDRVVVYAKQLQEILNTLPQQSAVPEETFLATFIEDDIGQRLVKFTRLADEDLRVD